MVRIRLLVTVALAIAAFVVTSAQAAPPKLVGAVAESSYNITLKEGGTKVTRLKPGTYTFVIKDSAASHNFHLTGPAVNKKTGVAAKVVVTWTLTLKKGKYRYFCDPHASFMSGTFKVA